MGSRIINPDSLERNRAANRQYHARNKERINEKHREYWRKIRREVIEAYGGKCACCGEATYEFLAIDHIEGKGNQHRKSFRSGSGLHRWLKVSGFPEGFRVLCHNCNCALGFYGCCPHQKTEAECQSIQIH